MADEHLRFERLAVGHVVGGLDEVDSAHFRSHLVDCRDCRTRVAELRGIASDLVATEREERAARATVGRTELAERVEEEAPPVAGHRPPVASWPWRVVAIGLVPLLVLGVMAWGVWTRGQIRALEEGLSLSTRALQAAAAGEMLDYDLAPTATGVSGIVAVTDDQVVIDLAGFDGIDVDQLVRAALVNADGEAVTTGTPYSPTMIESGFFVDVIDRGDRTAGTVVVQLLKRLASGEPRTEVVDDLVSARIPTITATASTTPET